MTSSRPVRLYPCRRPRTIKIPGRATSTRTSMRTSGLEEEKRQLGHPQTNPRKSDSTSPDDEKSVQEKETSSWRASWLVCRSSH